MVTSFPRLSLRHLLGNISHFLFALLLVGCGGEEQQDPCEYTVCQNGGVCVSGLCQCSPGYSGALCQVEDLCYQQTCNGHGFCSSITGSCTCDAGYSGDFCEVSQRQACCECLSAAVEVDGSTSCLPISVNSCSGGAGFSAQCGCWEECYGSCLGVGYPYSEPPNGCMH